MADYKVQCVLEDVGQVGTNILAPTSIDIALKVGAKVGVESLWCEMSKAA